MTRSAMLLAGALALAAHQALARPVASRVRSREFHLRRETCVIVPP